MNPSPESLESLAFLDRVRQQRQQQAARIEKGVPALQRLLALAEQDSGGSRVAAGLLLGLYNGARFPFDLTDLRVLDDANHADAMAVIVMDHHCEREVHRYFVDGSERFERLAKRWKPRGTKVER